MKLFLYMSHIIISMFRFKKKIYFFYLRITQNYALPNFYKIALYYFDKTNLLSKI